MKLLKHIIRTCINKACNNIVINNILIFFKADSALSHKLNPYTSFVPADHKSVQENAGYSNRQEINEVLEKSKKDLLSISEPYLKEGSCILDIGCGPGMYLSLFKHKPYELHASDINAAMIEQAKKQVPNTLFYEGDLLDISIQQRFNMVYCIGVLIYIPPSQLKPFIKKIASLLEEDGIFYLNFPHAISYWDSLFRDISYVQYSPAYLRKMLALYFDVYIDQHAFDDRFIDVYDKTPYKSLNPDTDRTYKNSYLLVAKKRKHHGPL